MFYNYPEGRTYWFSIKSDKGEIQMSFLDLKWIISGLVI
jgi:hypothetical protein